MKLPCTKSGTKSCTNSGQRPLGQSEGHQNSKDATVGKLRKETQNIPMCSSDSAVIVGTVALGLSVQRDLGLGLPTQAVKVSEMM